MYRTEEDATDATQNGSLGSMRGSRPSPPPYEKGSPRQGGVGIIMSLFSWSWSWSCAVAAFWRVTNSVKGGPTDGQVSPLTPVGQQLSQDSQIPIFTGVTGPGRLLGTGDRGPETGLQETLAGDTDLDTVCHRHGPIPSVGRPGRRLLL